MASTPKGNEDTVSKPSGNSQVLPIKHGTSISVDGEHHHSHPSLQQDHLVPQPVHGFCVPSIQPPPVTPELKPELREPFQAHPADRFASSPSIKHLPTAQSPLQDHPSTRHITYPATVARVQPPVILSTHQRPTRSTKISHQYAHPLRANPYRSSMTPGPPKSSLDAGISNVSLSTFSSDDYMTLINLSPPLDVGPLSFPGGNEWSSMEDITRSRAREIMRRLGKGSLRRRSEKLNNTEHARDSERDRLELERELDAERRAKKSTKKKKKKERTRKRSDTTANDGTGARKDGSRRQWSRPKDIRPGHADEERLLIERGRGSRNSRPLHSSDPSCSMV